MTPDLTQPPEKDGFLEKVHAAFSSLQKLLDPLEDAALTAPLEPGGWSPKDLMAHIADWEQYVVLRVEARRRGETPPVWGPDDEQVDEKNAELMALNQTLSLDAVRSKAAGSHAAIVATVESLSEAELFDDALRESVIGKWGSPVWLHIAGNTYLHYEEHAETLRNRGR